MTILQSVIAFAEERGIIVDAHSLPRNRACVLQLPGRYVIGYDPDAFDTDEEAAEAIAHELGHILTGTLYEPYTPHEGRHDGERRADAEKNRIIRSLQRGLGSV